MRIARFYLITLFSFLSFSMVSHGAEKSCVNTALNSLFKSPTTHYRSLKQVLAGSDEITRNMLRKNQIQEAIWYLESTHQTQHSSALKKYLEASMANSKIIHSKPITGNPLTGPVQLHLQGGVQAVFKIDRPQLDAEVRAIINPEAEVLAYEFDQALGLNRIPMTIKRKVNGVEGSMQVWIQRVTMNALNPKERRNITAFDYLINNRDRHLENYLVRTSDGTREGIPMFVGIDHGASFIPEGAKINGKDIGRFPPNVAIVFNGSPMSESLYRKLKNRLTEEVIRDLCRGKVPDKVADEIIVRRQKLLDYQESFASDP